MVKIFFSSLWVLILVSCNQSADNQLNSKSNRATNFKVLFDQNQLKITTFNKGALISTCTLDSIPNRIAVFSSSQAGFIDVLNQTQRVKIVSNPNYFYNSYYQNPKIISIGDMSQLNIEKLISTQPDLIIALPGSIATNSQLEMIKKLQIPLLITTEYSESSPLAQAEWIKVYGAIFRCQNISDSIFNVVKTNYEAIKQKASQTQAKPIVISGFPWKNNWFLPTKNSLFDQLITDAGGSCVLSTSSNPNTPISLEKILINMQSADFWLNISTMSSRSEILNTLPESKNFKPFKKNNCYNNILKIKPYGANDYWEMGMIRPDWILSDVSKILQNDSTQYYFYKKLD